MASMSGTLRAALASIDGGRMWQRLAANLVGVWRGPLGRQAPDGSHIAVADVLVPSGQAYCVAREAGLRVLPCVEQAGPRLATASSEQAPVHVEPKGPVLTA